MGLLRNRGGTDAVHPQQFIREEGDSIPEQTETPVLDLLASMTADSIEASNLDAQSLMLVRIAALVAIDAPPASYLLNLGVASELDIDAEQVRDVLAAVAPIVGTARVVSARARSCGRSSSISSRSRPRPRKRRKPIWGSPRHRPPVVRLCVARSCRMPDLRGFGGEEARRGSRLLASRSQSGSAARASWPDGVASRP